MERPWVRPGISNSGLSATCVIGFRGCALCTLCAWTGNRLGKSVEACPPGRVSAFILHFCLHETPQARCLCDHNWARSACVLAPMGIHKKFWMPRSERQRTFHASPVKYVNGSREIEFLWRRVKVRVAEIHAGSLASRLQDRGCSSCSTVQRRVKAVM